MQPSGNLRVVNKNPYLFLSYEDLQRIKYLVKIAPQEAQWFHRVEKIVEGDDVLYRIYEMYIPEQTCSSVEVDTSPQMMVDFYKTLKKEHGDATNQIMANMVCWCHSHHTMGVNPSGQDSKQFKEQIDLATQRNVAIPQLMMIFNKKNQYFCRIWDPEIGLMFENPKMIIEGFDFSYLDKITKERFKKKAVSVSKMSRPTNPYSSVGTPIDWHSNAQWWAKEPTEKKSPSASKGGTKKKKKYQERIPAVSKYSSFEALGQELNYMSSIAEIIGFGQDTSQVESIYSQDLIDLIEQINQHANHHEATVAVIDILDNGLDENEIEILGTLITGTEEEVRSLEDYTIIAENDDVEEARISIYEYLINSVVEPSEFLCSIYVAKTLADDSLSPEEAEHIIDFFIEEIGCNAGSHPAYMQEDKCQR